MSLSPRSLVQSSIFLTKLSNAPRRQRGKALCKPLEAPLAFLFPEVPNQGVPVLEPLQTPFTGRAICIGSGGVTVSVPGLSVRGELEESVES